MIRVRDTWIGINTLRPNRLIAEAILAGAVDELSGYESIRREVRVSAHSRLDLSLHGKQGRCYVEIKNVTLALADAATVGRQLIASSAANVLDKHQEKTFVPASARGGSNDQRAGSQGRLGDHAHAGQGRCRPFGCN
jgi:hypothetical protein